MRAKAAAKERDLRKIRNRLPEEIAKLPAEKAPSGERTYWWARDRGPG